MIQQQPSNIVSQLGFTLLELLIVITIIGILAGVVTLSFGAVDQRRLSAEADRLSLALNQAADASLMQQETIAWFYDKKQNHYEFRQLDHENNWESLEQALFSSYQIKVPSSLIIERSDSNKRELSAESEASEGAVIPNIIFLSSGEYSPFKITLSDKDLTPISLYGNGFTAIHYLDTAP